MFLLQIYAHTNGVNLSLKPAKCRLELLTLTNYYKQSYQVRGLLVLRMSTPADTYSLELDSQQSVASESSGSQGTELTFYHLRQPAKSK